MRREMILSAANESFATSGYNASLSEIAKASGIRKQTLYNYFENKDELFYEVIKIEIEEYFEYLNEIISQVASLSPEEQLRHVFFTIMDFYRDRKKLKFRKWMMLINSEPLMQKSTELVYSYEINLAPSLSKIVTNGIESGSIRDISVKSFIQTYITLIHGALDRKLFYQERYDIDIYINNVWTVFWLGVSTSEPKYVGD